MAFNLLFAIDANGSQWVIFDDSPVPYLIRIHLAGVDSVLLFVKRHSVYIPYFHWIFFPWTQIFIE